jgi:UDP-glucose 4-epimerase
VTGKVAIVTGGAGFVGSHLVDSLLGDGFAVTVVDDLSTGRKELVNPQAGLETLDISDPTAVDGVFDRVKPERVFHLAAQAVVTVSVKEPARDCEVNVMGTLNVLEAARRHGAPLVFTSTGGALYGDDAPLPTPETFYPQPLSPYGASKWAGESYVRTWSAAHGVPHAICRLGNVYGPRQSPHGEAGVVAIFSRMLWEGRAPTLYGHGDPTRDYVYVEDVVSALRAASGVAGIFNVATGRETTVRGVFDQLQRAAGTSLEPTLAPLREGELHRSCMDPSHTAEALGWRASVAFEDGAASTYGALVEGFEREHETASRG